MEIRKVLRKYRLAHHLLQKEIAGNLGISREHYARLENGSKQPSVKLLNRVCTKFHLKVKFVTTPHAQHPLKIR